jgi:hypothetical protein
MGNPDREPRPIVEKLWKPPENPTTTVIRLQGITGLDGDCRLVQAPHMLSISILKAKPSSPSA